LINLPLSEGERIVPRQEGGSTVPKLTIFVFTLALGASCLAQGGLAIRTNGRHERPADAERIYVSACSAVEREFRISRPLRPQVTLVVGADKNGAYWGPREIRLTKWDPYLFAQGVVMFAFEDLLPDGVRMKVAKLAVTWADSTVDAKRLAQNAQIVKSR
jgi:hypothetical protein